MANHPEGILFPETLQREIKDKFLYVDRDPDIGERLMFDNAGGAFRLKKAVERAIEVDSVPDDMHLRFTGQPESLPFFPVSPADKNQGIGQAAQAPLQVDVSLA